MRPLPYPTLVSARPDPVTRQRRHHLHGSVVQSDVRKAVLKWGITKPASCHTLRHSFATPHPQGVAFLLCHPSGREATADGVSA